MRRGRKTAKNLIIGIIMGLIMITYGATVTQANNIQSNFTFVFNEEGEWQTTIERLKDTSSEVYMNCTYVEVPGSGYEAYVYGYRSEDGISFLASTNATFWGITEKYIENTVINNGGDKVYIRATPFGVEGTGGIFMGYWRPDMF